MRRGLLHHFFKKSVIVFSALALILTGVFFTEANGSIALASEESTAVKTNDDGYYVKSFSATDFKQYRQEGGNHTYPKLTASDGTDYQDWLFAGWFENEECTQAVGSDVTSVSGEVFAKFVDADLSYIKCQVTPDTYANSEKTDMRLISALESDDYSGAGFLVTYKGNEPLDCPSTSIYARLSATDDGMQCGYSPAAFNADGKYFSAVRLLNIAGKNFDAPFYIQSYWVTLDGTTVLGMSRYVRVEDSYNKIVNVPVRVYDDAKVTSGSVSVSYDSDRFSLYTTEEYTTGYDAGNVFDTVSINADTPGTIVIEGSLSDSTSPVTADGIIANLRLQLKEGAGLESNTIFGVGNESFTGDVTTLDVSDVTFKNYPLAYSGGYDTSWYDGFNDEDVEVYVINSAADLYGLAHIVNSTTGTYAEEVFANDTIILGADMSINEGTAESAGWTPNEGATEYPWTPIGGSSVCFEGVFNGNGNTIQGIVLKDTDAVGYAGLFGQASGTIKNFSITNSYVESNGGKVGSAVGYLTGNLESVYSKAIVVNSAATDNNSEFECGGLVGRLAADGEKKLSNCWFEGTVKSTNRQCGGLVGRVASGDIMVEYCLNSGTVTNDMDGGAHTGGLFGRVQAEDNKTVNLHLDNLLNKGIVNTLKFTNGSVIGYMNDSTVTIVDTYATNESYQNPNEVVTSIGWKEGATLNGSVELCVEEDITGYTSYNTIAALDYCTYNNPNGFWVVRDDGVPALKSFTDNWIDVEWFYDADEEGYVIRTAEALYGFSAIGQNTSFEGRTVKLGADIELNKGVAERWGTVAPARAWKKVGTSVANFQGTFDGQGHTISGMYLKENTEQQGMFGRTTYTSVIKNFRLENSYFEVTDDAAIVGSVVGYSRGEVSGVYSDAYVVASSTSEKRIEAGGIAGRVDGTIPATVDDCWFEGQVELKGAAQAGGGIVGKVTKTGNISNCLFTGSVSSEKTANLYIGGIMGSAYTSAVINITNCLSDGKIDVDAHDKVGSIVGGIKNNSSKFTMLSVYATQECYVDSDGQYTAFDNAQSVAPDGGVEVYARADIQDEKGFTLTGLDFTDYWVAKNDSTPELKTFSTDGIDVPSMQPYTGWYNPKGSEFVIKTVSELYGFATLSNTYNFTNQTVKLGADIELNDEKIYGDAETWGDEGKELTYKWTPIGYKKTFYGNFDGQGYSISGLYMNGAVSTGFFYTVAGGTLENFRLVDSYMESSVASNGGVVRYLGGGTLDSIYCDVIINSTIAASDGSSYSGGLIGQVTQKENLIRNCWFAGKVYSHASYFSGVIGACTASENTKITVENCLVTGSIFSTRTGGNIYAAGFCGRINKNGTNLTVKNSLFAGEIGHKTEGTNVNQAAAVVGLLGASGQTTTLTVSSVYCVNGALKTHKNTLETGVPSHEDNVNGDVVANYYTGEELSGKVTFYDEADITGKNALTLTGLDFTNYWAAKTDTTKTPELLSFTDDSNHTPSKTQEYTGWYEPNNTDKTEYVLTTVNELYGLSELSANGYDFAGQKITLGADITINDEATYGDAENWGTSAPDYQWTPIKTFAGEFDGAGYTISGIYINNTSTVGTGLFGTTTSTSNIHDLRLENSYIYSSKKNVGSIAGIGNGTFDTIYSDAIVSSTNYNIGGIVGVINSASKNTIQNCWYNGEIALTTKSGYYAGGILGTMEISGGTVTIEDCLNSADISCATTNNSMLGGICGSAYAGEVNIANCLSVGNIEVATKLGTGSIIGFVKTTASLLNTYGISLGADFQTLESTEAIHYGVGYSSHSAGNGTVNGAATLLDDVALFYGEDAKTNAPDLFDETITTAWTTVDGAVPVLKSFEDYTVPGAKIVSNGVVKKTIVYANEEYATIATNLQTELKELTGFDFEIQNDISVGVVSDSIVIGKIYTEECINLYGYISGEDSALAAVGSNSYLCGTNTTTLQSASDALVSGIVVTEIGGTIDESTGELTGAKVYATVPSDLFTIENDTTASEYQLLGTSLAKYSIVIDDEASELNQLMAEYFQEQVFTNTNIYLEIVTDATDTCGYDIVFGNTERTVSSSVYTDGVYNKTDYGYTIVNVDNNIAVGYTDSTALLNAYDKLIALFSEDTSTGINLIGTDETVTKVVKADSSYIRVMSSNIYTQNGTDFNESLGDKMPSWKVRAEIVAEVYRTYKPDFFGLQEASFDQQDEILKYIDDLYAKVEFTGTSKNQTPIFYRKDLYQVEDQKYYDFGSGRHYEWALYSTIGNTDEKFIHMNLHYNPVQSLQADDAQIVNNEIKRLTTLYPNVPIAVTGDYNNTATSTTYATMVAGTSLASGAEKVGNEDSTYGTWHTLGTEALSTTGPIDIVSITTNLLEAKDYKVIYDPIICWGSDHYPVFLDVARK